MRAYSWARAAVACMFILCIVGYAAANLVLQHDELYEGITKVAAPESLEELTVTTAGLESAINESLYERTAFIELYSSLQVLLDKQENGSFDLVQSESGHLVYGDFFHEVPAEIPEYAYQLYLLKQYAARYNCEVIFVTTQPLHVQGAFSYASGLPYKNDNPDVDALLYYLQSFGVDYLDSREVLRQSSLDPSEYRYRTDHHWTVEACFEVHKALTEKLNAEYSEELDADGVLCDLSNYKQILYEDAFVGSLAQRSGLPFSGVDDFTLILPTFETNYYVEEDLGYAVETREGPFDESILVTSYLYPHDAYLQSLYGAYLGGSVPYRHIVNRTNEEGPSVLFVHDSFGLPLASFFAANTSRFDMVWPYSETLYTYEVDMQQLVADNIAEYDYIIVSLIPDNYTDEGFDFVPDG